MLSFADFREVVQMRRDFVALRDAWKSAVGEYYARKFDSDQPRVPAGSSEGGRWTRDRNESGEAVDVHDILERAKVLAASHAAMGRCVDLCLPLLNRFQAPGSDRNQFDFRKCLNACLGLNR